jgi:[acyl-carrier-protein] S-malonyltransferase
MVPWLASGPPDSIAISEMEKSVGLCWRAALESEVLRSKNRFAQPLMTGTSLAAWEALRPHLPELPTAVAGYSVGELAAYACAGVLSIPQAIGLSNERAHLMDQATEGQVAGLMSVAGLPIEWIIAHFPRLSCAIRIDHDHAIFGGLSVDLDHAQTQLSGASATCKRLAIDVASHTPMMASASDNFATTLDTVVFVQPNFPIVVNAGSALCRRVDELKFALSAQICQTVDWAACMDVLAESGVACVIEIGPGRALATMWNRRHPEIPARSMEDFRDPRGAAKWIERSSDSQRSDA